MEEKKREVIQRHHKLEEAQLQIQKEMDLGKLLSQTITALRQEKQETNKALEESQRLIERQSVHVNRTKEDNVALLQENQALKGDNEKLNGHMMEKDENCKSIKGRFENTKITLEEENRKQQLKLESLQLKYDSLQSSFQEIEESNCKFKSQVREQERKIQGLQIAQHKNTAAVTCSGAAHDTLTSPADGVTHQSTKSILRNNLWATSSSSSAAVKHQFNSGGWSATFIHINYCLDFAALWLKDISPCLVWRVSL
ncbi:uncharacterized protein LOC144933726 isoform X1 [Lampetra fluviatilis]